MEWVDSSLKKRRWTTRNVGGEVSLSGLLTKGAVVCTGSQEACATSVFARCWRQEFYFNEFFTFDCSSPLLSEFNQPQATLQRNKRC